MSSHKDGLSLCYVLFDFDDKVPGVAHISAIFKPTLPLQEPDDSLILLKSWVSSQKHLTVRWPASSTVESRPIFNIEVYRTSKQYANSVFRNGRALRISDDKDGLKKEAIAILTERKLGSTKTCRRQLVMPTDGNAETSSAKADQSGEDLPITADENCPQQSSNKRALTVVEENCNLRAKVQKLEEDEKRRNNEIRELKEEAGRREEEITRLSIVNGERENEILELKETLENGLTSQLAQTMKENLSVLSGIIDRCKNGQPSSPFVTPSRSHAVTPPSTPSIEMIPLHGNILIDKTVLLSALAAGKAGGDTERSLNKFISIILDSYWQPQELAQFCLSGRACPSKKGSQAKEKFPADYLTAFQNYTVARWEKLHPGSKLSSADVNKAIGAKLLNCHTNWKKVLEKQQKQLGGAEGSTSGNSSPSGGSLPLEEVDDLMTTDRTPSSRTTSPGFNQQDSDSSNSPRHLDDEL